MDAGSQTRLSGPMRRIAIVGPTAAGKSTLAERLAAQLGIARLELDSVYIQPGWSGLPVEEFRARVADFVSADAWIVDGNYAVSRDLVLTRADTVVWVRPTRSAVMRNVIKRTAAHIMFRKELWNGNRQSLRNSLSLDPGRSMIAVAWHTYDAHEREYRALHASAKNDQRWVLLSSRREVDRFVARERRA